MRKRVLISSIVAGVILLSAIGNSVKQPESLNSNATINANSSTQVIEKVTPICDGTIVTKSCKVDDVNYSTYIYHPAVAEKSHNTTVTTYEEKVTSYCTQCNDGSYSPSCATGKGACSHHGGVAQWNAPRYSKVPTETIEKVIDTPAQEAYYEKVLQ